MPEPLSDWPTTPTEEARWDAVRKQFLHDPEQTYLNTGSWGVLARATFDALIAAARERERNPTANRPKALEGVRAARADLARFVGARAEDLAFVTNVTVAINVVIAGLAWREGDEIVASDQEYGAIDNCLHHASQRWGLTIRRAEIPIPPRGPEDVVAAFEKALTDRTRLLLCSHVAAGTGLIVPVRALAALAHDRGAMVLIDGAHAPGMIPLDLADFGCDFYGGNCHKWLCAPKGVGFLHVAPAAQERVRHLVVGWGYSREGTTTDDAGHPRINDQPYMWGIEEWGTTALPERIATGTAVRVQEEIGPADIARRGRQLAGYVREQMARRDWAELISPSHPEMTGSISTFRLAGFGEVKLREALQDRYGITVPVGPRDGAHTMRVSTHLYNTFAEIDRLVSALDELREDLPAS